MQRRFVRQIPVLAASIILFSTLALPAHAQALSAYFGDSILPNGVDQFVCPPPTRGTGYGGMPIVFESQIDTRGGFAGAPFNLDPSLFRVKVTGTPEWVTPECASLLPALNASERRTVLLAGEFGLGGFNRPIQIQIVGDVFTTDGASLKGLVIRRIADLNAGPRLLLAERFTPGDGIIDTSEPDDGTRGAFCPAGETAVVVKLTFSGGPTGPSGGALRDDPVAMAAIQVVAIDGAGRRVVLSPFALRDVDNDNSLDACLGVSATQFTLSRVAIDSHVFFSPQNAPAPAATVDID